MAESGASQYTFHIEATDDPGACIRKIRENGMKVLSLEMLALYDPVESIVQERE